MPGEPRIRVIRYDDVFNYSAINNFAVEQARGTIIGMLNNDVEVISPEWLTEMVALASRPEVGCVGAKLYYPNGLIQHAGVIVGLGGVAGHSHKYYPGDHPGILAPASSSECFSCDGGLSGCPEGHLSIRSAGLTTSICRRLQ